MNPSIPLDPVTALHMLLAMLPASVQPWVSLVVSLITIANIVVGVTNKSAAPWAKVLRFVSGVVHADEPGTFKVPLTNITIGVTAASPPPAAPGK
jgi:hypothetical protein